LKSTFRDALSENSPLALDKFGENDSTISIQRNVEKIEINID